MSLTKYQSKFVTVGGYDIITKEVVNELWTSNNGLEWRPLNPPMLTNRCCTSSVNTRSPEALVVAGGQDSNSKFLVTVEVLIEYQWTTVNPLPRPSKVLNITFHNGYLYCQYYTLFSSLKDLSYSCKLEELIASSSDDRRILWDDFELPFCINNLTSFGSQLISISKNIEYHSLELQAYSRNKQKWVEVGINTTEEFICSNHRLAITTLSSGNLATFNNDLTIF